MKSPDYAHKPIRQILGTQSILIALLPFILLCSLVAVFAVPEVKTQIQDSQAQLSANIADRVETHLRTAVTLLKNSAELLHTIPLPHRNEAEILESNMGASSVLKALYILSPQGQIENLILRNPNADIQKELTGFDLSSHWIFRRVAQRQDTVWTDIFLTMVGSGISVAAGVPSGDRVLIGEVDLSVLNRFLREMTQEKGQRIMILDRRGRVIADPEGEFAANQVNLSHIPLVKSALEDTGAPRCKELNFSGTHMVGTILKTRFIHWHILVLTPITHAYNAVKTTFLILLIALILTILAGVCFAMVFAGRMADRFEALTAQVKRIMDGHPPDKPMDFEIREFQDFAMDIHQMAEAITQREAYNRVLFADSPAAMLVLEAPTGICRDCNRAALFLFGTEDPQKIIGGKLTDFSPERQNSDQASAAELKSHMDTCIQVGRVTFEWRFLRGQDQSWHGEVTLSRFTHGPQDQVQVILHDISHEKHIEKERQFLERQLLQAQKMESIGTLSGGIAHDFNNILFPISGYTELLQLDTPRGSSQWDYLDKIMDGVRRARALVKRILTFSRQNETGTEGVVLHEVAREALKLVQSTLPSTIMIHDNIRDCPGQVLGNSIQIHQVIMNLCTNAFHAMEDQGGVLTLGLTTIELTPEMVKDLGISPGEYARLSITDTGMGMDNTVLDQIFNPYFTTKPVGKGTGLGLSVVHGIVHSHGGRITVDSRPQCGSRFDVYLPLSRERALEPGHAPRPHIAFNGQGHILIVDDEPTIVTMLESMLTRMGYQVTSETQSNRALEQFKADPMGFDLVITDMTMPGMTGYQLAANIMAIRPGTPVILCTGYSETMTREKATELGVSGFLAKPILRHELGAMIQQILGQAALARAAGNGENSDMPATGS